MVPLAMTSTKTTMTFDIDEMAAAMVQFRMRMWTLLWEADSVTDFVFNTVVRSFLLRFKTRIKSDKMQTRKTKTKW